MLLAHSDSQTLVKIKALTPDISRQVDEIEAARGLPASLVDSLRDAGLFRMALPTDIGGDDLHLLQVSRVLEELARADASVAWTGMVAVGWNKFISHFPKETLDAIFSEGPDVYLRGAIAPKGTLRRVEGGYLVKGRWPLGSGSFPHKFMIGNCLLVDQDEAPVIENGRPTMLAAIIPAAQAQVLDTWHSVGLRGTASHDFVFEEQFVPDNMVGNLFGSSSFDHPIHVLSNDVVTAPTHGSVAIGIAQGAIDDFCELARNKRPAFGGGKRVADDPIQAYRVGELAVRLKGLRAMLETSIVEIWDLAHGGDGISPMKRAEILSIASFVQHQAMDIVNEVFAMSGATPCYTGSSIQRRWRDARCVAQHIAATTSVYGLLGSAMMGEDIRPLLM